MRRVNLFCLWVSANIFVLVKRRWIIIVLSAVCALLLLLMFQWGLICSSLQPKLHIQKLCKNYASGQSIGNLCPALCQYGGISSVACQSFYMGKEVVFSGVWDNSTVVFKSPKESSIEVKYLQQWFDNNGNQMPTEEEFSNMIKTNVRLKFNISVNDIDARKMSSFQFNQNDYLRDTEMANVWALLQDNEYLALSLYEKYDVFPKIVGTCGPMFAVQQMTSISGFWHLITLYDSLEEWKDRVRIAVKMMELLNVLENGPPDPLHICDVKMSHFGVTDDFKKIKYLDLDSVHPNSIVSKITGDGSPCSDHNDCDFFDCRSFCNLVTLKCEYGVVNNNVQIVCEKIFLGWLVPGRVIVPGLLLGAHTPPSLVELLENCANPAKDSGKPRALTPRDTQKRLFNFLVQLTLP